nr:MAG TPA: hypothetical protein [Caudoviricetes sp.]
MDEILRIINKIQVPRKWKIDCITEVYCRKRMADPESYGLALIGVYYYGYIMGKREERARRNRKTA